MDPFLLPIDNATHPKKVVQVPPSIHPQTLYAQTLQAHGIHGEGIVPSVQELLPKVTPKYKNRSSTVSHRLLLRGDSALSLLYVLGAEGVALVLHLSVHGTRRTESIPGLSTIWTDKCYPENPSLIAYLVSVATR